MDVRLFVCLSQNVRLRIFEQTAGPTSANACLLIHVDKVHLPANFHLNRQRLNIHFHGLRFESRTIESSYMMISQRMTDRTNMANTGSPFEMSNKPLKQLAPNILAFLFGPYGNPNVLLRALLLSVRR